MKESRPDKSLAYKFPELMKIWISEKNIEIDPSKIGAYSTKEVSWKCSKCGYEFKDKIYKMTQSSRRCSNCDYLLNNLKK